MKVGRVYLVWALLFLGLVALVGGMVTRWYEFEADTDGTGFGGADDDVPAPRYQLHTDFWHEGHGQLEGMAGGTGGAEALPQIGQVMTLVRIFYFVGLVGAAVAVVGVLFRMRGLPDGKGFVASVAVLSLLSVAFATTFFAVGIAGAYNDVLENQRGESPEIAFITLGTDSEDGEWQNVTSEPRTGWYLGALGVVALAVGFGAAYLGDVRRVRAVLTDDEAARAHREERLRRDAQGVERFRREERP